MSRYIGPKKKILKRFEKPQRTSEYGRQLLEKQKVKFRYGLRERQFKRLFEEAAKQKNVPTGTALLQMLEQRLDNVVYRLGLAKTRPQARQFVTQGRVLVDGQVVTIPSYRVKVGQSVTLTSEAFQSPFVQEILKEASIIPTWLQVSEGTGKVVSPPQREEIDKDINEDLIVSFYTR